MHTVHLGAEEVNAYLLDLLVRLEGLGKAAPSIWCPIGQSGRELVRRLHSLLPRSDLLTKIRIRVLSLEYDRKHDSVFFVDGEDQARMALAGENVLVLDSSVHSGHTMLKVIEKLQESRAGAICSYSLVMKENSAVVPNYFGLLIGDHDRALFMLDRLPNNRVAPFGCIRALNEADLRRTRFRAGLHEYDKWTWGDYWYDQHSEAGWLFYVFEHQGKILGIIRFRIRPDSHVFLDLVVVAKQAQGRDIGTQLIRLAETRGRFARCREVRLWSDERVAAFYRKLGYVAVKPAKQLPLEGVSYKLLRKPLVNHIQADCDREEDV